jgi:hypothetical protein
MRIESPSGLFTRAVEFILLVIFPSTLNLQYIIAGFIDDVRIGSDTSIHSVEEQKWRPGGF